MITQAIMDRLAGIDGKIGISYIDLEEEKELFFGNSRVFQGSGAIMLMALVECFKQMEEGKIKEDDLYRLSLIHIFPNQRGDLDIRTAKSILQQAGLR